MALHYGVDFAIFYACLLALFSYFAFWYVPLAARAVYVTVRSWLEPRPRDEGRSGPNDGQLWWERRHSQ